MISLNKITKRGRALYLAYDQGMEHGPIDFNDKNVDPNYIIKIAQKGKYNAVIFQKGIAEKYQKEIKKSRIPLIIKLNGKTSLRKSEPISTQLCSVEEAIKLGAKAVGYTIYIGSEHEATMLKEFEKIQINAHAHGLPVIAWIYPRGKGTKGKSEKELLAYACRVGLEIGADIVKVHWNGKDQKELTWAVKAAGKTKVVIAGGSKTEETILLNETKQAMQAGCIGLAIGRNIWQSEKPLELTKKIKKIIWR
jgi:class I fructose-bisphosphate aldolase